MSFFAVFDAHDGNVSVCEVSAENTSASSRLCYFRKHIAGAAWPHGPCVWVSNEHIFTSDLPALDYARARLRDRIGTLSLTLLHICHDLEGPTPKEAEPESPKTLVWERLRHPEV